MTGVSGLVTATFVYDGDGKRVNGTIGGVTTRIAMCIGAGSGTGGLKWLFDDHLGSATITMDGATGAELSELRYTGQWMGGTGLYDCGARMKLVDLLDNIEMIDENSSLYIKSTENIQEDVDVIIIPNDLIHNGGKTPEGLNYLLEVYLIKEVLVVWKNWRDGKEPTTKEKINAIYYFVKHDAYLPPEE